jgi:hypothetical protein
VGKGGGGKVLALSPQIFQKGVTDEGFFDKIYSLEVGRRFEYNKSDF